jgi:hypothetical protein
MSLTVSVKGDVEDVACQVALPDASEVKTNPAAAPATLSVRLVPGVTTRS